MKIKTSPKRNGGLALVAVMVLTIILLVLGAAFLRLATTERISADESVYLDKAFYLAEAGLERGREWLNATSTLPVAYQELFEEEPLGEGSYDVSIDPISATQYEISSTGRFGSPTVAKTLKIVMQRQSVFSYGIFGDENVSLRGNAYIDSYNSGDGSYGGANVNSDGDVGTNAISAVYPYSVYLCNNATINGDVIIGPGGDVDEAIEVRNNAEINGTSSSADSLQELPEVPIPTGLPYEGSISLSGNSTSMLTTSGEYSFIQLNSNSRLTLDGDLTLYITGALSLNSNSQIIITEGSNVEIYLSGTFSQSSNTQINNLTQDPTTLAIYGTDSLTAVNWASNSDFYGAFYAPNADVDIHSNAEIYGSIIADTIDLASNSRVHYDERLADESDFGCSYRVVSWDEEPAVWE